jgi:hypothetical protein
MLCRGFRESSEKRLVLRDVDARAFSKVLELWCGANGYQRSNWNEIQELAAVADRFRVTEVLVALENAMMEKLSVEVCMEMLTLSRGIGTLKRLEEDARKMTMDRFSEVVATAGFMRIGEDELQSILEDMGGNEVRIHSGTTETASH